MGKALYRQYRPTSLDTVIGQRHVTDTLKNALKTGAISHAYLFTGPRGVGKTSIARILAHEVNSLPYNEEVTHLDIIEIDAASNRRIDEIRDLRDKVHISPTSAKYKVYIIDEVHMLTREAFNALLKTLEEPPAHAIFILATTEAHKVPDTIISRTQRYSFKPIEQADIATSLGVIAKKEKLKIDKEALKLIADHGQGSFRDSIGMLDQIAGFGHENITAQIVADLLGMPARETIDNLLDAVMTQNARRIFDNVLKLKEQGTHPAQLAQTLINNLRDMLIDDGTLHMPQIRVVPLMKALLPLTGTYSSFEAIEIALLDSFILEHGKQSIQTTNEVEPENPIVATAKKTQVDSQPQPDMAISKEEKAESIEEKSDDIAPVKTAQATEIWQKILDAVKGNHNTLYGVLRMAEAQVTEDSIVLTFRFSFHKKQITQARHNETLQEIINTITDKPYKLVLEVKADKSKSTSSENKNKKDDTLKNVSNIFGGAELLES